MGYDTRSRLPAHAEGGFTYLAVLLAVALLGGGLGASAEVWHTAHTREKERELLFAGHAFRVAIERYYLATPGSEKQFPASLEEMLEDPRVPGIQRYLRRIYRDPLSGQAEWGLVKNPEGRIVGVHSLAEAQPLKTAQFGPDDSRFEGAARYADWVFMYRPERLAARNSTRSGRAQLD